MIKVCIIEDEPDIRKLLRKIIEKQDGFEVVSESDGFAAAMADFAKYRPDVAFVDIDLKGESGLECAKIMSDLNPQIKIVFETAHSEYMANAFEIYAFDYLVKPFNVERVVKTLNRIKGEVLKSVAAWEEAVVQPEKHGDKLMIKGKEQVLFVNKKDIIFAEHNDGSTSIVTGAGIYKTSAALGSIEEKLDAKEFMRSHKSYIINISLISQIEPYGRWTYIVKFKGTEETALMTARCYEEIKKMFG